jgi:L-aspartate oxidase
VHGANRLASNSLLEGLVFGARVSSAMLVDAREGGGEGGTPPGPEPFFAQDAADGIAERVGREAWERLGVIRHGEGIEKARAALAGLAAASVASRPSRDGIEARNRWIVARAVAEAAAWRRESRGAHFRLDYPETDDAAFRAHSVQRRGGGTEAVPVGEGPLGVSESG